MRFSLSQILLLILCFGMFFWFKPSYLQAFLNKVNYILKTKKTN